MNSIKILVPLLLIQCASMAIAFNGRCPPSWSYYNGSCYKLSNTYSDWLTFGNALSACEDLGASLVSISNENENNFVTGLNDNMNWFWIGLNDIYEEGVFQWTDGTPFRYTFIEEDSGSGWTPGNQNGYWLTYTHDAELDFSNWLPNEPKKQYTRECDCVKITPFYGNWDNTYCHSTQMYICEKDVGAINETTIKCPHSFETIMELGSSPSKIVNWTDPLYLQADHGIRVEKSHSSGDRFPPGVTWVNYTIHDMHNPVIVTCNFSVTVLELDTTRPKVFRCPDDITVTKMHNLPLTIKWPPPIATDLTKITTTSSHPHGGKFKTGVTNVIYTFTDESGNSARCSFDISVIKVDPHSRPSANTIGDSDKFNRLVIGLYVILCFIGFLLALHLVLKIVRRRSFNIGEQSHTNMDDDVKVEMIKH